MPETATVFVIDPEEETRAAIQALLRSVALPAEAYFSGTEFLRSYDPARPGCLVLDARLPGVGGLELQERLAQHEAPPPMIFLTAHGDIPMAVRAMRNGAIDFLEKPFRPQVLLDRVYLALERDALVRRAHLERTVLEARAACLTPREHAVMDRVVAGLRNREIAERMGVTRKAVEAYRARVMRKMLAPNLPELVRMSDLLAHRAAGTVGMQTTRSATSPSSPPARPGPSSSGRWA